MRPLLSLLLCASIILAQQNGNPRPAAFPASVATDTTLGVACNSARSTLDGAINDSALSFTVASGVTFCAPAYYTLGSGTAAEVIKICSASGATVTVCAGGRGIHGPPRAHPNATPVQILNDENYHNQLAAEVKAIQNGLGGGFLNTALLTRTMLFATDGAYDIGTTSGNRPGNLYASNGVWAFNVIGWPTKSLLVSPVNGNVLLTNATFSNFGLLQLGGTGATFPALKRNAAGISIRLADDSADAAITASQFNGSGAGLTTSTIPITALAAGNYSSKIMPPTRRLCRGPE
jgi:hypothetical protein